MGINVILPIMIGIGLMLSIGTTIAPSIIEDMKISKIENKTIENQEIIKNAIIRYIQIEEKAPVDMNDLKNSNLLKDYHNDNLFNQGYTFEINSKKGYIKIKTKIDDNSAMKYFENNIKYPNKPNCITMINNICQNNEFETFYLVDNDIHDILLKNVKVEYTDPEYLDKFVEENIGKKDEHLINPPKDGDKDFVIKDPNTIIEYVYDEESDTWFKEEEKTVGGIGANTGVEIKLVDVPYHIWNEETNQLELTSEKHEKIVCNTTSINKEVFVINQITGLGEIVWVAPNTFSSIQTKIFGDNIEATRKNATNIIGNGTNDLKYIPNNICISNINSLSQVFYYATNFNQDLNRWDTSKVTNMYRVFEKSDNFNKNISSWDTSLSKSINGIFTYATIFNNGCEESIEDCPLNWNTSNITDMYTVFSNSNFNQDVSNWDTSNVTNMENMFYSAEKFNSDIGNWNTSNVTNMEWMFYAAKNFNQDIGNWNVSNVTDMNLMLGLTSYFNFNLNNWNTSKVKDMSSMFLQSNNFNNGCQESVEDCPLNWNTSSVTDMENMFYYAKSFNQDISYFDTSKVTDMGYMFDYAKSFNQPLNNWNVSNVIDMSLMFYGAENFNQDLNNWNVSKVTNMGGMFNNAKKFNQPLNSWNTSNVTNMNSMFYNVTNFNQPLNSWNTSSVTNMEYMFHETNFNQNISSWDVSNLKNFDHIFFNAKNFNNGCIDGDKSCPLIWNTQNATSMYYTFTQAPKFNQDLNSWNTSNVTNMGKMFRGAQLFNGDISS